MSEDLSSVEFFLKGFKKLYVLENFSDRKQWRFVMEFENEHGETLQFPFPFHNKLANRGLTFSAPYYQLPHSLSKYVISILLDTNKDFTKLTCEVFSSSDIGGEKLLSASINYNKESVHVIEKQ